MTINEFCKMYHVSHQAVYRIKHKEKETSFEAISKLSGMQKYYAVYLRSYQIAVFDSNGKQNKRNTYRELVKSADLLNYITLNNIHSIEDFKMISENRNEFYSELKKKENVLKNKLNSLESVSSESDQRMKEELQKEMEQLSEQIRTAEKERNDSLSFMERYVSEYRSDEYSKAIDEYNKLNKLSEEEYTDEREKENQKSNEYSYRYKQDESR